MPVQNQVAVIYAVTNGYLDDVALEKVREWERGFLEVMSAKHSEVLDAIRNEGQMSDEIAEKLVSAIEGYNAAFAAEHEMAAVPA